MSEVSRPTEAAPRNPRPFMRLTPRRLIGLLEGADQQYLSDGTPLVQAIVTVKCHHGGTRIFAVPDHHTAVPALQRLGTVIDGTYMDAAAAPRSKRLVVIGNAGGPPLDVPRMREADPTTRAISPAHRLIVKNRNSIGMTDEEARQATLHGLQRLVVEAGVPFRVTASITGQPYEPPPAPTGPVVFPDLPSK